MQAFLNGRFVDKDQGLIRLEDRGLTFGDGLFEILRTVNRRVLFFEAHLERMKRSAGALDLPFPFDISALYGQALELIMRNQLDDGELYIELTRGADRHREHLRPPPSVPPTLFMLAFPLRQIAVCNWSSGAAVHTYPDLRHGLCEHKTLNLLANVMAKNHSYGRGGYEALMLRTTGDRVIVTEGGSSNYFFVQGRTLVTPGIDNILPGITRGKVIELARKAGMAVEERPVGLTEALDACEVFLVSTVSRVMPVRSINDRSFGAPGPVTRTIMEAFETIFVRELSGSPGDRDAR